MSAAYLIYDDGHRTARTACSLRPRRLWSQYLLANRYGSSLFLAREIRRDFVTWRSCSMMGKGKISSSSAWTKSMNISVSTLRTYTVYIKHITKLWTNILQGRGSCIHLWRARSITQCDPLWCKVLFSYPGKRNRAHSYYPTPSFQKTSRALKHRIALNGQRHQELAQEQAHFPCPHHFFADKPGCANLQ